MVPRWKMPEVIGKPYAKEEREEWKKNLMGFKFVKNVQSISLCTLQCHEEAEVFGFIDSHFHMNTVWCDEIP